MLGAGDGHSTRYNDYAEYVARLYPSETGSLTLSIPMHRGVACATPMSWAAIAATAVQGRGTAMDARWQLLQGSRVLVVNGNDCGIQPLKMGA